MSARLTDQEGNVLGTLTNLGTEEYIVRPRLEQILNQTHRPASIP